MNAKSPLSLDIPRAAKGSGRPTLDIAPEDNPEPRTTVSTRLTLSLQERMRHAAYVLRREKQVLIEEAMDEDLKGKGL